MSKKIETEFKSKCAILADLWINYRDESEWADYFKYNDLGLPLAYMVANGIVEEENASIGTSFVNEAFELFLAGMGVEDSGFYVLEDVFDASDRDPSEFNGTLEEVEDEDDDLEEEEEQTEWDQGWNVGYASGYSGGIDAEQNRIQELCSTYTEMYLDMGKGQKAVLWREVADALKPVDDVSVPSNEDDGF